MSVSGVPEDAQRAREAFVSFGRLRWPSLWAYYVLALLVGQVLAGGSAVTIGAAFLGVPLAWLAGWIQTRWRQVEAVVVVALVLVGLAAGYLG